MPDIWQIVFGESSPNLYRQTNQTILSLIEMILRFCLVFTIYTVHNLQWQVRLLEK